MKNVSVYAGVCCGIFSYSFSFYNEDGNIVCGSGYISKSALYEAMQDYGATPAQIKEAREIAKGIKKSHYVY